MSASHDAPHYRTRYIPVSDWNLYHVWPPAGGLRHLIFYKDQNGFDKVIRKVGSRILVDENAFFNWMDERHATGGAIRRKPKERNTISRTERREVEDAMEYDVLGGDEPPDRAE